jgi:hypothetical protein
MAKKVPRYPPPNTVCSLQPANASAHVLSRLHVHFASLTFGSIFNSSMVIVIEAQYAPQGKGILITSGLLDGLLLRDKRST